MVAGLGSEDGAAPEPADREQVLVVGGGESLEMHSSASSPAGVHVGKEHGEVRRRSLVPLVRLSDPANAEEDVRRGTLGQTEQGSVEHVQPTGDDLVELTAPVVTGVPSEPLAQSLGRLKRGVEPIQVLDLGERGKARVVVPEVREGHRRETGALATLDGVRADGSADPQELVKKEACMARLAPRRERKRAEIELAVDRRLRLAL